MKKTNISTDNAVKKTMILDGDKIHVAQEQDVQAILDNNEKFRNESSRKSRKFDDVATKVASVPMVVVAQWRKEGFDVMSAEANGMSEEEYQIELYRRLERNPYLKTVDARLI